MDSYSVKNFETLKGIERIMQTLMIQNFRLLQESSKLSKVFISSHETITEFG
jgi:hypothetical protein